MPGLIGALVLVLLMVLVLTRVVMLRKRGIQALNFGKRDKSDFLLPPFALFYFYLVFANAFDWPTVSEQTFFDSEVIAWLGVVLCLSGLVLLAASLVSFGASFRVGIDDEHPDKLITTGIFAYTRNPIYVAFGFVLVGEFLIFPNWILLVYPVAAAWLIHRQVLREEEYLKRHYGKAYLDYTGRVRRYL